jgi:hypothetical protein
MNEPSPTAQPVVEDTNEEAVRTGPPATPTWVKAMGVVFAVVVMLVIAKIALDGGVGGHGPGLHGG